VWQFRVNIVFQKLHPLNPQYTSQSERKYGCEKVPLPNSQDTEKKGKREKEIYMRRLSHGMGFLAQGKFIMSFNLRENV